MITPYRIDCAKFHLNSCNSSVGLEFYATQNGKIVITHYDDEYDCYYVMYGLCVAYEYFDGKFIEIHFDTTQDNIWKPATKKELQDAGLWDMVVNKEDFPSLEEELDEYLRIGEEIEKERTSDIHNG